MKAAVLLMLASLAGAALVDPRVLEDTEGGRVGSFSVHFEERADLGKLRGAKLPFKERGWAVVEELEEVAARSQKPLQRLLRLRPDVERVAPFFVSNCMIIDGKRSAVDFLSQMPGVKAINSNRPFKVDLEVARDDQIFLEREEEANEWNVDYVKAPTVWSKYGQTGTGLYANADTGVDYTHPALMPNYNGNQNGTFKHDYNWWDGVKKSSIPGSGPCGVNAPAPCDDNSHGTHTTGTSVGQNGIGVAPGARWIACRNMDRGFGTVESYLSCLQFFLAPHDLQGNNRNPDLRPLAVGNSYGCLGAEGCSGGEFSEAVEALRTAGVFMSVSAGNSGPSCSTINAPPATEPSVISVAATAFQSDAIAAYSSRGPVGTMMKPDLSAPGSSVRSCVPGGGYSSFSGTSMASPHVGALVNLLVAVCPKLQYDVDALQELMETTARRLYTTQGCGGDTSRSTPNNVFGHGMIDAAAAAAKCSSL